MPDSCDPTSTVRTACSDPVATMRRVIGPSVTRAVETWTSAIVHIDRTTTAAMSVTTIRDSRRVVVRLMIRTTLGTHKEFQRGAD